VGEELFGAWAARLAQGIRKSVGQLPRTLEEEAQHLAAATRLFAPRKSGALQESIRAQGPEVIVAGPAAAYAKIQNDGGPIVARRHGWLTIPVRPGYVPGPGLVTLKSRDGNQIVVRSGTYELWAIRRRVVTLKGSRYADRALEVHLEHAAERVLRTLPDAGQGGRS
jgi:hypothetical protein